MFRAAQNQKGQMTIEMFLILALLTSLGVGVSQYFRSNQIMATLVEGPWLHMQGMIESGVWRKPAEAKQLHPNLLDRHATLEGEIPP